MYRCSINCWTIWTISDNLAQWGVCIKVYKGMLNGTNGHIFDKQMIVYFLFFNSFDHIFTRRVFRIAIQKISPLLAKNLISGSIHHSLFLYNIIYGTDKIFTGKKVTFCTSHYRSIGFWYSGDINVLPLIKHILLNTLF